MTLLAMLHARKSGCVGCSASGQGQSVSQSHHLQLARADQMSNSDRQSQHQHHIQEFSQIELWGHAWRRRGRAGTARRRSSWARPRAAAARQPPRHPRPPARPPRLAAAPACAGAPPRPSRCASLTAGRPHICDERNSALSLGALCRVPFQPLLHQTIL